MDTNPEYQVSLKAVEELDYDQGKIGFYKIENSDKLARGSSIQVAQLNLIIHGLFDLSNKLSKNEKQYRESIKLLSKALDEQGERLVLLNKRIETLELLQRVGSQQMGERLFKLDEKIDYIDTNVKTLNRQKPVSIEDINKSMESMKTGEPLQYRKNPPGKILYYEDPRWTRRNK